MLQSTGIYRNGLGITTISIYIDNYPELAANAIKKAVAFVMYGKTPLFLNMDSVMTNTNYSRLVVPGVYVKVSHGPHQDVFTFSFHQGSWNNPPFYTRTFNLG